MERADKFFIDGQWVDPIEATPFTVINPATEEAIGEVLLGGAADVDAAIDAAHRAFPAWSQSSVETRLALLERIVEGMTARLDDFGRAALLQIGSPVGQARFMHGVVGVEITKALVETLRNYRFEWIEGNALIIREPIGVCALITPWNAPVAQSVSKVIPALAAGCTMLLKPSENTPYDAIILAEVLEAAGVPAGVFNLVHGAGPVVGAAMAAHPKVDFVSITGSTRAGAEVARLAAATVKRVGQELGGKSPNILLPDADFAKMVPIGVQSGFRNCGQSCSAPTRMIVPRERYEECKALARATADSIIVGDPNDETTQLGPIQNAAQFAKVQQLIQLGLDEGAELIAGGLGRPDGLTRGYYVRPTVLGVPSADMEIAQTEIFGPVLCLIPYEDVDDAVRIANSTVYGLGGYVQSENQDHACAVARRIRSGTVAVNNPPFDFAAPFGGYKMSGNGRERGQFGLDDYLEVKSIVGYRPGAA